MNDDELNNQCQKIDYYYQEFLELQKDLLNTPIEELLSRFYFAAFEKCQELEKQETAELKKQIDQLSNDNHVLKTSFITQQEQIKKLKTELQNYADVINRLMGTQLTDAEEIGRLIEIAQYRNWGDL